MIEESITVSLQQKQKAQSHLYTLYSKAMTCLKNGQFSAGTEQLQNIIRSPFIDDYQMRKLKKSALLSLGNMMNSQQKYLQTLGYFYAAFEVQELMRQQSQDNFNPDTTNSLQYNLLLKMYQLSQKLNLHQQSIYLLKKSLKVSPLMWRSKLLNELMKKYEILNMNMELKDLKIMLSNPQKLNQILNQKEKPIQDMSQVQKLNFQLQTVMRQRIQKQHLPSIKIYVKDHNYNYSIFQYLLTVSYVLLKCQSKRNFNSKRYLKKKYEATNTQWKDFLTKFNPVLTKIQLIYVKNKQDQSQVHMSEQIQEDSDKPENQMEEEAKQSNQNQKKCQKKQYFQLVQELTKELLRIRYIKKKKTKNQIALQQQNTQTLPSAVSQTKNNKKIQFQKSSFQSMKCFFNEIFQKNNFKKSQISSVRCLNQTIFDKLFQNIMKEQKELQKQEGQQNQKQKQQKDKRQEKQVKQQKNIKKPIKDKKQLQQQKLEHFNNLFIEFLKKNQKQSKSQQIQQSSDNMNHTFLNVYEFYSKMQNFILKQVNSEEGSFKISSSQNQHLRIQKQKSLRLLMGKNTLKIIPYLSGYLEQYLPKTQKDLQAIGAQYFSILVQYFEYMCKKPAKQTQFTLHQNQKIDYLRKNINQNWQINIKLFSKQNNLNFNKAKLIAIWSRIFVIFYAIKENIDLKRLNYYKELVLHYNGVCKRLLNPNVQVEYSDFLNQTCQFSIQTLIKQRFQQLTDKKVQIKPINPIDVQVQKILKALDKNEFSTEFFIKINSIFDIYFKKLQEKTQQFTYKFMQFITQKMKIDLIISTIYKKFTQQTSGIISSYQKSSSQIKEQTLLYFIKINILGSLQSNQDILRIIFYLTNFIMKSTLKCQKEKEKYSLIQICKIIIFYHELITLSEKRLKIQKRDVIVKKFYQNIISKNLNKIYYESFQDWKNKQKEREKVLNKNYALKLIQMQEKQAAQKLKKQLLMQQGQNLSPEMDIQQIVRKISSKHQIQPETILKYQLQDQVIDIINDIYFNSDFSPKKIQDSIGFFIFLSRNYSKQFECQEVQLETAVVKVFKKCYKIFQQKRKEILSYCEVFTAFQQRMEKVWNGQQKEKTQQFVSLIKNQRKICQCCCNQQIQEKFHYKEIIYILARFFQTNPYTPEDQKDKDSNKSSEYSKLDEQFYKEYLLLDLSNLHNQNAWINFIRSCSLKSYLYFDSLILLQPIQALKNKFLYTKRIINFLRQNILTQENKSNYQNLTNFMQRTMNILNLLKIKEREYFMILKNIETKQNKKQTKQFIKKYYEGIRTILHKFSDNDSVTSAYLGIAQLKIKDLKFTEWGKQKLQKIKNFIRQVNTIVKQLQFNEKEKEEVCTHLEEDLVVESYIFLLKTLEQFIQKFILKIVQKKQTDINFGQILEYLDFITQKNILAVSQKYKPKFILQAKTENNNNKAFIIDLQQEPEISQQKKQQKIEEQSKQIILLSKEKQNQNNGDFIQIIDEEINDSASNVNQNQNDSGDLKQNKGPFKFKPLDQKIQEKNSISQKTKNIQKIDVLLYIENSLSKFKQAKMHPKYLDLIEKINCAFNGVLNMLRCLPKFQLKRFKYRRSVTSALLYCSQIYLKFSLKTEASFQIIKDYYNIRSDDIVFVFTHFQRKSTEKNQYLSQFYNRGLVHNIQRLNFIQHLIQLFAKSQNIESLIILIRKLNKVMTNNAGEDQGKQVKYLLMLYWQAVDKYIEILQKWATQKQIDQRYEKLCLQFKNRIKKSITCQKDKQKTSDKEKVALQNPYIQRIQKFIKDYEVKYQKKIKMKKGKKQKIQKQIKQRQKQLLEQGFLKNQNLLKIPLKKQKKNEKKLQKEKQEQKQGLKQKEKILEKSQKQLKQIRKKSNQQKHLDINLQVVLQIDSNENQQHISENSGTKKRKHDENDNQ